MKKSTIWKRALPAAVFFALALALTGVAASAQSLTTGALSGVVTDPSGAVIPGAKITAINASTGSQVATQSQGNGGYRLPLLEPGKYTITVEKTGFQTSKQAGVAIAVSTTGSLNFKMQVGTASQTVEVTGQVALIQPQNANNTTTLDTKAIENLPNPGGDITMLAQISGGAQMDVHGAGGTAGLSFNGIQGNAVEYTSDGMDVNDPFNNDNNSGPSNMLLGQNAVSEVTVNTNAYSVDQGRMAAGQVNYLSKSGGNAFHGDLSWQWNGRALNAYDYFVKSQPLAAGQTIAPKPFDNVNNWTASVGGPIIKNKLFFFFDNEGTRIDLPTVINYKVPTQAFETYAEQQLLLGGYDTSTSVKSGSTYKYLPAEPNELPFVQNFFKLYGNTAVGTQNGSEIVPNTSGALGCNLLANGTPDPAYNPQAMPTAAGGANPVPSDPGCYNNGVFSGTAKTPETLTDFRIDYTINQNNTLWGKYQDDQGTQTTGISPVNAVFDENSFQPDHQGVLDWTHVFSPTLTNDAQAGFLWYSAIFNYDNPTGEHAAIAGLGELSTPFGNLGSTSFPQGRNVTQYQIIDNLTWTRGSHSFKFGENFRRELVNDHDFAEAYASDVTSDYSELMYGAASSAALHFPISQVEQFKDFSLDLYAGDTWQAARHVTVTYGVRATHNSNPIDSQPYISNFDDFTSFPHPNLNGSSLTAPPNADYQATSQLWSSVPLETWQPRVAVAWQPRNSTLIKAGWGMFSQVATASAAETLAKNPPFYPTFTGGFAKGNLGANGSPAGCTLSGGSNPQCGYLWDPTQPFSAVAAAIAGNVQYQANFAGGSPSCAAGASLTCVPQVAITALPKGGLTAPMVYQYNFTVQQQIGHNFSMSVGYVGTRSQHNSYTMGDNGYQTLCSGCFAPFLYSATGSTGAPDPRFLGYSQTRYDGYGRYDGMQVNATERLTHGLTLNFNYTWSHCLTTGTPYQDGGGIASSLANTYADCGDDITHVANASYTYQLPIHAGNHLLGEVVNNWQISGSTFAEGGVPLFVSMTGGSTSLGGNLVQATGPVHGYVAPGVNPYSRGVAVAGITAPGSVQWLNPMALVSPFDGNTGNCYNYQANTEGINTTDCQFLGNNGTTLRGPTLQWTNFDLSKSLQVTEKIGLRLDFQAYNLFNHPNFADPTASGNIFIPGTVKTSNPLGLNSTLLSSPDAITSMASPNNGLLGQNGGDSAPRMLAFQAKIVF